MVTLIVVILIIVFAAAFYEEADRQRKVKARAKSLHDTYVNAKQQLTPQQRAAIAKRRAEESQDYN